MAEETKEGEVSIIMQAEKFKQMVLDNSNFDYGLCPPPIKAQDGLNILIKHFLGDNWYVTMPLSREQANTEAVYEILKMYPDSKFKQFMRWLRRGEKG